MKASHKQKNGKGAPGTPAALRALRRAAQKVHTENRKLGLPVPRTAGWGIDGIDRLHAVSGGVIWEAGSGDWRFFAPGEGGAFISPAEARGTRVHNDDGSYT